MLKLGGEAALLINIARAPFAEASACQGSGPIHLCDCEGFS